MRSIRVLNLFITILLSLCATTALANSWYLGVSGGGNVANKISNSYLPIGEDVNITSIDPMSGTKLNNIGFDYKVGWHISGEYGYQFDTFRLAGEILYIKNDYKDFTMAGQPLWVGLVNGYTRALGGLFNAYYDFNADGEIMPYIGIGGGMASIKNEISFDGKRGERTETKPVGQLMAGVGFALSRQTSLLVNYRYLSTLSEVWAIDGHYKTHMFGVGLRYSF
jgi:OmpA-OmpF porin, OOP family